MLIGVNDYKLILLDTNAIREIVTNTNMSEKGFLERFFACSSDAYAPCFSIYNVIELMPYQDIYEKEGRIYRWNKYHYLQSGRWNGQRKICNNEKPLSYYGSRRLF